MPVCASCGGDNAAAFTICQYCDQPLVIEKHLDVAWTASAQGTTGEGRVDVVAPGDADAKRVRALCEAAFAKGVDALGTQAEATELQARMQAELVALLPPDHRLESLEVTQLDAFVLIAGKVEEPASDPPAPDPPAPNPPAPDLRPRRVKQSFSFGAGSAEVHGTGDELSLGDELLRPVLWVLGAVWGICWWVATLPLKIASGGEDDEGCCGCVVLLAALPLGGGVVLRLLA